MGLGFGSRGGRRGVTATPSGVEPRRALPLKRLAIMKIISGTIAAIDGEQFQLGHDGENHRFTLAMDAVIEGGDLHSLFKSGDEVTVHYDDIPTEASHVAFRVFPSARPTFYRQT
jgi:hypothetical protein